MNWAPVFGFLTLVATSPLTAQTQIHRLKVRLPEGSAVRLHTTDGNRTAGLLLEAVGPETRTLSYRLLTAPPGPTSARSVDLGDLRILEAESGNHGIRGAVVGAVIGLFVGSLLDWADGCDGCGTPADLFRLKTLAGWTGGGALGYIAGSGSRRWTTVSWAW